MRHISFFPFDQNTEKKYPRISSDWNDTPPEQMEPTIRLVNQMNVAKETNLIMYKKHNKSRTNSQVKQISKPVTFDSPPRYTARLAFNYKETKISL